MRAARDRLRSLDVALPAAADVVVGVLTWAQRLGRDDLLVVALHGLEAGRADVGGTAAAGAVGAVAVVAGWAFADDLAVDISVGFVSAGLFEERGEGGREVCVCRRLRGVVGANVTRSCGYAVSLLCAWLVRLGQGKWIIPPRPWLTLSMDLRSDMLD